MTVLNVLNLLLALVMGYQMSTYAWIRGWWLAVNCVLVFITLTIGGGLAVFFTP